MTAVLAAEISAGGPIPFRRFMETALYHPGHGYSRRASDPFGKDGDFFTAEQLQPVFGRLMAALAGSLRDKMGGAPEFSLVELGAGRMEMAPAFSAFNYIPVEKERGEMPERFTGVVFANEFFDALPVDLLAARGGTWREMLVGWREDRFHWVEGDEAAPRQLEYARRYLPAPEEGTLLEVNLDALEWLERVASRLERGWVIAIDYGYTARELIRFPEGTLMSYRRHTALEDVLSEPGGRDITAHVNFTALMDRAVELGFAHTRLERLVQTLMTVGEKDQFASALSAGSDAERTRLTLQLKTLLFGMGETFRTLLLGKNVRQ
ncbi:MAG: SAM-dependent methyltransferase [Bryobacteraceae bacterium]